MNQTITTETMKTKTMKTNKTLSTHAATAVAIRIELKAIYSNFNFKVTSSSYSMGNSVRVSWEDGPATKEVSKIVDKYQYGHFNGMEDIYENSNTRNDIPQAKFVQTERSMSDQIRTMLHEQNDIDDCADYQNQDRVFRTFSQTNFNSAGKPDRIQPEFIKVNEPIVEIIQPTFTELFDNLIGN